VTLGSGVAYMVGGSVVQWVQSLGTVELPWFGAMYGWQPVFFLVGLPGLVIALLMATVREPIRRGGLASAGATQLPVRDVVAYVVQRRRAYGAHIIGISVYVMVVYGLNLWGPTYLIRTFGWSAKEAGFALGMIALLFTSSGAVCGGWLADRLAKRGYRDAHLRAAFIGTGIGLPFAIAATMLQDATWAMVIFAPTYFFGAFPFALAPAAISTITPNQLRGQLTALYLFTINLLGFGVGPAFIGFVTDNVFKDENMVGYSISLVAALAVPVALVLIWRAMGQYAQEAEGMSRSAAATA